MLIPVLLDVSRNVTMGVCVAEPCGLCGHRLAFNETTTTSPFRDTFTFGGLFGFWTSGKLITSVGPFDIPKMKGTRT